MSALSNLYAAAEEIRTLLMPFAFLLCVLGLGEMGWRAGSDARAVLGALLRTIIVVALIAGYPSAMKTGQQAFIEMRSNFTTARDAKFVQLLSLTHPKSAVRLVDEPRQDRARGHRIFLPGNRAVHADPSPLLSGVRHRGIDRRLPASHRLPVLFLYAILGPPVRRDLAHRAALACRHLPRGHRDPGDQRHAVHADHGEQSRPRSART